MKKHVDSKHISIPPYISTAWQNVKALYMRGTLLIVELTDGNNVQIPNLTDVDIEEIFSYHAAFLEQSPREEETKQQGGIFGGSPFRFSMNGMDGLTNAMKHTPEQANMPELPKDILEKIASIAKIVSPDDITALNPPVEGCNCVYCQITRAILGTKVEPTHPEATGEPVSAEDLHFQEWIITQIGDKLYEVANKLQPDEKYRVFLGDPVGCTCGKPHCEHIVAVLKS